MTRPTRLILAAAAAAAALTLPAHSLAAQDRSKDIRQEIRHELIQLPYYSVFDFLAFKYDRGTVVLMGYAYSPNLKQDADRAVKRVAGVDTIENRIEQLPPSQQDDDLRRKIYYAIYTDPFLRRTHRSDGRRRRPDDRRDEGASGARIV